MFCFTFQHKVPITASPPQTHILGCETVVPTLRGFILSDSFLYHLPYFPVSLRVRRRPNGFWVSGAMGDASRDIELVERASTAGCQLTGHSWHGTASGGDQGTSPSPGGEPLSYPTD